MCGFAPAYAGELQSAQTLQRNPSTPSQKAGAPPDFYFASVYTLQEEEAVRGFFQRVADAKGNHEEATQLLLEAGYALATADLGDMKVGCIVPPSVVASEKSLVYHRLLKALSDMQLKLGEMRRFEELSPEAQETLLSYIELSESYGLRREHILETLGELSVSLEYGLVFYNSGGFPVASHRPPDQNVPLPKIKEPRSRAVRPLQTADKCTYLASKPLRMEILQTLQNEVYPEVVKRIKNMLREGYIDTLSEMGAPLQKLHAGLLGEGIVAGQLPKEWFHGREVAADEKLRGTLGLYLCIKSPAMPGEASGSVTICKPIDERVLR
jgi:hypothetical protein